MPDKTTFPDSVIAYVFIENKGVLERHWTFVENDEEGGPMYKSGPFLPCDLSGSYSYLSDLILTKQEALEDAIKRQKMNVKNCERALEDKNNMLNKLLSQLEEHKAK